jgi:hypothetical protein
VLNGAAGYSGSVEEVDSSLSEDEDMKIERFGRIRSDTLHHILTLLSVLSKVV